MSQRIVDVLEAVEIQEQHRDLLPVARRQGDRLADAVVQEHAIGQAGQEIVLGRMGHLQRHRARRAHVAEDDDRAGHLPFAVVDRGDGVFDRNLKSVAPDEDAVRRQVTSSDPAAIAISIGSGIASRLVASRICRISAIGRPTASCSGQPVMFSATRLRKVMFPAMSVQMTASPMQLSVTSARSFSIEQRLFHGLALDGIAQARAGARVSRIEPPTMRPLMR